MSTELIWQTVTADSKDTEKLGRLLGQQLSGGEVLELSADLGGGKTTFVAGLAAGSGASANVTSPTFTIQQIYKAKDLELHHFDFYRLDDAGVVAEQIKESLKNPKTIVVVEWAKTIEHVLPKERLIIELAPTATSPDERQVTVHYTPKYERIIKQLENGWQEVKP